MRIHVYRRGCSEPAQAEVEGTVVHEASELCFLEMIVKKMTVMNAMLNRAVNIAAEELDFDGS